jgi:iron complex transport system permease protein
MLQRRKFLLLFLVLLFFTGFILDLSLGALSASFSFKSWWGAFMHPFEDPLKNNFLSQILWHLRLPDAISVALSGFGLGLSGLLLQGFFRNPLADPGLIGVSVGAAFSVVLFLGLAMGLKLALGDILWALPMIAFFGAVFSMLLLWGLARLLGLISSATLLLAGIGLSTFFAAISSLVFIELDNQGLHLALWWSFGGETVIQWSLLGGSVLILLVAVRISERQAKALDVNVLGEFEAESLGVNLKAMRLNILLAIALSAGVSVALTGPIAFIGLMVPHVVRYYFGFKHRVLVWTSGLLGAVLLLFSSMISRVVFNPVELPLGVVTSFLGLPFFFYFLLSKNFNKKRVSHG